MAPAARAGAVLGRRLDVTKLRLLGWGALLALVAVAPMACRGSDAVRVATEGAYPPYNFINDDGEIDGSSGNWATSSAAGPDSSARG